MSRTIKYIGIACISTMFAACVPTLVKKTENKNIPASYSNSDTTNSGTIVWNKFFTDPNLTALVDEALKNNQEFNIIAQEIIIAQNEVRFRKGQYIPSVGVGAAAGIDRSGRYTRNGAVDQNLNIAPGKKIPDPLTDIFVGANVSWEVDIWKKLRNSKKAAFARYLASIEGRNFTKTLLVAEIANDYYELMALDNQLDILKLNIEIQQNALNIVRQEKIAARVTELAVRRFEAEVAKNQSRQYYIMQRIVETENNINFLVGRFPQPIKRNSQNFTNIIPDSIYAGLSSQLLDNRPDIVQASRELEASKLDVKSTRAQFYPSFFINANVGYQGFNPQYLIKSPQSLMYNAAGQLMVPLINRNAIKANYYTANARQVQAVYNYERTILRAHIEVVNQLSNISNLKKSYDLKAKQVQTLNESITISTGLFKSARADYMEVLLTQRDAMESRFELIETKKQQMDAMINVYQALGGGWR